MQNLSIKTMMAVAALTLASSAYAADQKSQNKKVSGNDKQFIMAAAQDDAAEIEMGKLAQQNGSSSQIKEFGQRLSDDHSKSTQELGPIANNLGVTPPTQPSKKAQSYMKKLSKLQGDKFDHEFAKAMVKDHEKAVALFEKESKRGNSEELKQFAEKTLPTLQEHLKMARDMSGMKR